MTDSIIADITQSFGNQPAIPLRPVQTGRDSSVQILAAALRLTDQEFDALIVFHSAPSTLFILQTR
jgi:hypothetical protein